MSDVSDDGRLGRRRLVQGALAGLAASGGFPLASGALAAPVDPNAGPEVTPNPIRPRIAKGPFTVELVDFCTPPRTRTTKPFAFLNFVYHAGDGKGRLFACDSRGKMWQIIGGVAQTSAVPGSESGAWPSAHL